ncbi:MFS transporter [Erythrobacter sp. NFXS35]|uniref:MFS transporter n=1 Tax=Erythrobacter sp. NFXS35 TaxID=2818436 RepID=UPI0032DE9C42
MDLQQHLEARANMGIAAKIEDSAAAPKLPLLLCAVGAVIEGFDLQAASVTAPFFSKELDMSIAQTGYAFTLNTLGLFIGAMLGGWAADRWGRKPVLVLSVASFGLFCLCNAMANSIETFLGWRFLVGLGLGGALPNLIALAAESGPARTRSRRVIIMSAGMPMGGALISALIASGALHGWREVFIVGGIMPLAVALLMQVFLRGDSPVVADSQTALTNPGFASLFQEDYRTKTILLWLGFCLTLGIIYLVLNWLPTLLIERGFDKKQAIIVALCFNFFGALGAALLAFVLHRLGAFRTYLFTYIGLIVSTGGLALIGNAPLPVFIAGGLIGVFVLGAQFLLYGLAADIYEVRIRGLGVGSAVSIGRMGSVAGPAAATAILAAGYGPNAVLLGIIPTAILALVCALFLLKQH